MLTRAKFRFIIIAAFAACLTLTVGAGRLVDRVVHASWAREIIGIVVVTAGITVTQVLTGGHVSYRKYVAAMGGRLEPPSRFWATAGPWIVASAAVIALAIAWRLGVSAPEGSGWRQLGAWMWIAVPGATLVFMLIARDWRRELAASSHAA